MTANALAIPKNIEDLCQARDKAITLYEAAYQTQKGIETSLNELEPYLCPHPIQPKTDPEEFKKQLDMNLWRHAFTQTGLLRFMDARAKDDFERDLKSDTPEFTIDNIETTLLSAAADADKMFARGLVNVFHRLSPDHKTNTNSPFKINPKAVIRCMVGLNFSGGLRVSYYGSRQEELNDIDRVIKTLDGKKHQPRELECSINAAFQKGPAIYEDAYYRIKGFKNGNMHIAFKRQDLLDRANLIIAKYYGDNHLAA